MNDSASEITSSTQGGRRGGLIGWGVFLIVVASVILMALMAVLSDWVGGVEETLSRTQAVRHAYHPPVRAGDVAAMMLTIPVIGGILWTGIAACLGRRWVRPVILSGSVVVMGMSLLNFIAQALMMPSVLDAVQRPVRGQYYTNQPTAFSVILIFAMRGVVELGLGAGVPYAMFRFFWNPRTVGLLDELDPRVSWADRCPVMVFGWAGYAALVCCATLIRLAEPSLVAFVVMLHDAPAVIGLSVIAVLLAWGVWLCYRQEVLGWGITFVVIVGLRVSTAVFLWTGGNMSDLMMDPTAAASLVRLQQAGLTPWWLFPVVGSLECAVVVWVGILVGQTILRRDQR